MKKGRKLLSLLLIVVLLVSTSIGGTVFAADQYYRYTNSLTWGVDNTGTAIIYVKAVDSNEELTGSAFPTYCMDQHNNLKTNNLILKQLSNNNIRSVVANSYPKVALAALKDNVNAWSNATIGDIDTLSIKEAITGTQHAVWHYSDGFNRTIDTSAYTDVDRLYLYLLDLSPLSPVVAPDLSISNFSTNVDGSGNAVITFSYNDDLTIGYSVDLATLYPTVDIAETVVGEVNTTVITIAEAEFTSDISFSINLTGTLTTTDVYKYEKVVGTANQNLVGYQDKEHDADASMDVYIEAQEEPAIMITKTADISVGEVGDTITYTITVENTGNVPLDDVTITDELTDTDINIGTLTVGEIKTLDPSPTYLITAEDLLNGSVDNIVNVVGTYENDDVSAEDTATVLVNGTPSIDVTKIADVSEASEGDTITYTIVVTNTGNVSLAGVFANDSLTGSHWSIGSLAAGASVTVSPAATYVVTSEDVLAGVVTNIVTAGGWYGVQEEYVEATAEEEVNILSHPAIRLVKEGDLFTAEVGDTVTYMFVAENMGDVPLTNVTITDPQLGLTLDIGDLAVGDSFIITGAATHIITLTDLANGEYENIATVEGTYNSTQVDDEDNWIVHVTGNPSIVIIKTADISVGEVGDTITYTITVENTGNVPLDDVTITDELTGTLINIGILEVGETQTLDPNPTYVIELTDLEYGSVVNVADVHGTYQNEDVTAEDTATVLVNGTPSIDVTKVADVSEASEGDTITYTIVVTNTGNVSLAGVFANDSLTGSHWSIGSLAPGESVTVSPAATYVVTNDDVLAAVVTNLVTAGGWYGVQEEYVEATAEEEVTILADPSIELNKFGDISVGEVGDVVSYGFEVVNTGNVPLTSVTITDAQLGLTLNIGDLAVGDSFIITGAATHILTLTDLANGIYENTATAEGTYNSTQVNDEDSWIVTTDGTPVIRIEKTSDIVSGTIGDVITYTITVSNPGNVDLEDVMVNDTTLGLSYGPFTLAAGDTIIIDPAPTHTINLNDVYNMEYINTVTVQGTYTNENIESTSSTRTVTDEAECTVETYALPSIVIEKTVDQDSVYVGTTVNYTITITNTGNVPLNDVSVYDPMFGTEALADYTSLAPGESKTITEGLSKVITEIGTTINTATVSGWVYIYDEVEYEASDDASVTGMRVPVVIPNNPSILVTITPDSTLVLLGTDVTFTITVTNTGNTILNNVTLINNELGFNETLTDPLYLLQSRTYTVTKTMDQLATFNTQVIAEGISPQFVTVNDNSATLVNVYKEEEEVPDEPTPGDNPQTGGLPFDLMVVISLFSLGAGYTLFKKRKEDDKE